MRNHFMNCISKSKRKIYLFHQLLDWNLARRCGAIGCCADDFCFLFLFSAHALVISIFILFVVVYFSSSFPLQVILLKGDILVQNIYLYFLVWTVWFKSHCSGGDVSSNLSF